MLKWRTDMLPTLLDVSALINYSLSNVPAGLESRIVTCAFRNLSVHDDWYSSIPDLFSFGHVIPMEMLWGDDDFDYSKPMNPPLAMLAELGDKWDERDGAIWCAESELYAIFKSRLTPLIGADICHEQLVKDYFSIINDEKLGIVWFGSEGKYRPIKQAYEHPWWTEESWSGKEPVQYVEKGYPVKGIGSYVRGRFGELKKLKEKYTQRKLYRAFLNDKKD